MDAVLLDRDGVITVNRKDHIKSPGELAFSAGAAEAIARLTRARVHVGVCTNQSEVANGVIDRQTLAAIHNAMIARLAACGARIDLVLACLDDCPSPTRKPEPGMLLKALQRFGAVAARTPFVGDQLTDLEAAYRAGCRPVLVRTGLGSRTLAKGIPPYLGAVIHDDLSAVVDAYLRNAGSVAAPAIAHEHEGHEADAQRQGRQDAEGHGQVSRSRHAGTDGILVGSPADIQYRDRQAEKADQHG
jgi:D-glycero-D-manno-heptose 1,7-bisphosphate phosphatase